MPNPSDKCKNCGHPYRDHISGGGTCKHRDWTGELCDCDGFQA